MNKISFSRPEDIIKQNLNALDNRIDSCNINILIEIPIILHQHTYFNISHHLHAKPEHFGTLASS